MMMKMMMMMDQNLGTHQLELVWDFYACIAIAIIFLSLLILLEIIKGSGNFDGDSGLGTSRYKSTMSCTMSDVRMLLFSIV